MEKSFTNRELTAIIDKLWNILFNEKDVYYKIYDNNNEVLFSFPHFHPLPYFLSTVY